MSFYMTLPCNASMDAYPENRAGKFTTNLAREIVLEGEWEVGLTECIIPIPKHQLDFVEPIVYNTHLGPNNEIKLFKIRSSEINTLADIWTLMDSYPEVSPGVKCFYFSIRDNKISLFVYYKHTVYWDLENKNLATLLGFPPFGIMVGKNPGYTEFIAPMPFGPGNPFLAFVYCDLLEYNF